MVGAIILVFVANVDVCLTLKSVDSNLSAQSKSAQHRIRSWVFPDQSLECLESRSLMLSLSSLERMLANILLRSFGKSFICPPRKKRALAVNFLTPGGSVVLRKHDRHFAEGCDKDFCLFPASVTLLDFVCATSPDQKKHPFTYREKLSPLLIPNLVLSNETEFLHGLLRGKAL